MTPILFDFNGTMFADAKKHEIAWGQFLVAKLGRRISGEEFRKYVYGPLNDAIIRHFFGDDLSVQERRALGEEKERLYRDLCYADPENLRLVKGLPALLDALACRNVPMNIATCSYAANVDFYFRAFGLAKWFDRKKIAYDDGDTPGKPDPAIYLLAAKNIGVEISDCTVVEDSLIGIRAARLAGVRRIVAIATANPRKTLEKAEGVDAVIEDFTEFSPELYG